MNIRLRLSRARISKIFRISMKHGLVSVTCGAAEYAIFLLLHLNLNCALASSYVTAYLMATVAGYFLHNYLTFNFRVITKISIAFYLIQSLFVLSLGYIIINMYLWMSISPQAAKLMQLFTTFGFNVAIGRYLTFNRKYFKNE